MDDHYSKSAQVYDILYREILDYEAAAAQLTQVIRRRMPGAHSLLEAACGTGTFLAHLSREFEVCGFDLSDEMLAVARAKLPGVELRRDDMASFHWGRRFDVVICMFSSIGYLTAPGDLESAYRRFAEHLVPDGVLVVEPWLRPEVWMDGSVGTNRAVAGDTTVLRMNSSWLENDGTVSAMDMHHLVGRPGKVEHFVERHRLRLTTVEEHLAAFAAAGLVMDHDPEGLVIGRGLYVGGLG